MDHKKLREIIRQCDLAIKNEDFDALMEHYDENAMLVIRPGLYARGKKAIRQAFVTIAEYFRNSVVPTQGEMIFLVAGDTALVLSQTFVEAAAKTDSEYPTERAATYVFRKDINGRWLCAVDNSYGTGLLKMNTPTADESAN